MEERDFIRLEKYTMRFVKAAAVLLVIYLVLLLVTGCKMWKKGVSEKSDSSDSVRIEYRERIVRVPVTVEVEVPVENVSTVTKDSTSHLETSFAVSDASMIWIDGVPFLRHDLKNKAQKIEKQDSVAVVEKEKVVWKTRRVTYTKTEIREKVLPLWQKVLMWCGGIFLALLFVSFIVMLLFKKKLRR